MMRWKIQPALGRRKLYALFLHCFGSLSGSLNQRGKTHASQGESRPQFPTAAIVFRINAYALLSATTLLMIARQCIESFVHIGEQFVGKLILVSTVIGLFLARPLSAPRAP
jgi:hypothetical protein